MNSRHGFRVEHDAGRHTTPPPDVRTAYVTRHPRKGSPYELRFAVLQRSDGVPPILSLQTWLGNERKGKIEIGLDELEHLERAIDAMRRESK